jgi:hypothetical protein
MAAPRPVARGTRVFLILLALALLALLPLGTASAATPGYRFTHVATLGDPAPGGGAFTVDFEPYAINARGELAFVADLKDDAGNDIGEGVFAGQPGQLRAVIRAGQPAPGGGTFAGISLGHSVLNDAGDLAVDFMLAPAFTPPIGVNVGVYRYRHATNSLGALVVPFVTPAPGGGTFQGSLFHAANNNRGEVAFPGIVKTDDGIHIDGQPYVGLGLGIFHVDKQGRITSVVSPGDAAPGGGRFDYATAPWLNDRGDIAFGGHVAGEECIDFGVTQDVIIHCGESVYLRQLFPTRLISIAHQGQPAPGGGIYRLAFGPRLNNRGEVAFIGDLTPAPASLERLGVFLYSKGTTRAIARPGDTMPGGGTMVTATTTPLGYHLNNRGDVSFAASLDTDGNGSADAAGLYVAGQSGLRLVARTGTVIPGVGTIDYFSFPGDASLVNFAGAVINDNGQVFFQATLTDGRGVLLVAKP